MLPSFRQTTVALTTSCPSGFVNVAFYCFSPLTNTDRWLVWDTNRNIGHNTLPLSTGFTWWLDLITFASHNNFRQVDIGQRGLGRNTADRWSLQRHHPSDFFPRPQYKHCCARATYYRVIILPDNYRLSLSTAIQGCVWAVG